MFEMVPFRKNNKLARREDFFDNLFNIFDEDFPSIFAEGKVSFKVDLTEDDNTYKVVADLPGVKKEAINIDYSNNYLTISAKRDDSVEEKTDKYVRRERHYGEFRRSFYIDNVKEDAIDASFVDGVLNITLPKETQEVNPKKKIEIK